jgi:hypothetical protein
VVVGKHGWGRVEVEVEQLLSANVRDMDFRWTFVADRSVVRHAGFRVKCVPPSVSRAIETPMINTMYIHIELEL